MRFADEQAYGGPLSPASEDQAMSSAVRVKGGAEITLSGLEISLSGAEKVLSGVEITFSVSEKVTSGVEKVLSKPEKVIWTRN